MLAVQNRAAVLGPDRFPWWLDWRGRSVAIVACGPSVQKADVDLLRGRMPVLAIKEAHVRLAPWSDVVYGCEAPWWKHVKGLPDFRGLKLAWREAGLDEYPDIRRFDLQKRSPKRSSEPDHVDDLLLDEPGVIGAGGQSGFQALNIALQFGASRVLLVGFDCHENGGSHFYGRNKWVKARNPDLTVWGRWIDGMRRAADACGRWGIEVVNASPVSAIKSFPQMSVTKTLEAWGL